MSHKQIPCPHCGRQTSDLLEALEALIDAAAPLMAKHCEDEDPPALALARSAVSRARL